MQSSLVENPQSDPQAAETDELEFAADLDLSVFLRTVQQHHVHLSAMADQKASLLIGASFVVLTILFSQIDRGEVSIPLLTLGIPTIIACVLAVLAVSPAVQRLATRQPLVPLSLNILFFGHFAHMDEETFQREVRTVMSSREDVYRAMIKDIYQMGKVLHEKKYRYLGYSYRVFLLGLIVTFFVMLFTYFTAV
ncbi:MAG: hypothetical protein KDE51_25680 [Anaerolineales bacterium]|nr:hypothetical protein [Anaerolineales bacterium]